MVEVLFAGAPFGDESGRAEQPAFALSLDGESRAVEVQPLRRELSDEGADERAETATEGCEERWHGEAAAGLCPGLQRCDEGAVFALHRDEVRHHCADAQSLYVAPK